MTIRFRFSERKATQAAARLLGLAGGVSEYLKLLKLLYLLDRKALLMWGRPITGDLYFSMQKGPVLSRVYDIIKGQAGDGHPYWDQHISRREGLRLRLLAPTDEGDLSERESRLLLETHKEFGHRGKWELVEFCHSLPEWEDPGKSILPIDAERILEAGGKSDTEIEAIRTEIANLNFVRGVLG